MTSQHGRSACLAVSMRFVHFLQILDRVPKYSTKQSLPLYNPFFKTRRRDQSQLIDMLVNRLRVEYFLFGDRHVHALRLPRHSLAALVMHGAAVHSIYCLIIPFIPAVNTTKISDHCRCYYVGADFYVVVCP